MSLDNLTSKNILYLQHQFPVEVTDLLKEHLQDCFIFVLIYLPHEESRKKFRKINSLISDPWFITVYWYRDPFTIQEGDFPYIIKREHRNFVLLWFDLLIQLENSPFVINIYRNIIKQLKYKKHTRYIVVHQSYLMIEDLKIPLHLNHAINLFI